MDRLISGICGAGIVLLCESEYSALKLFKQRKTLFFFICQLVIWSSALETALAASVYFLPDLRLLPMLVIISIIKFLQNVSYPIMILLRLRFVRNFSIYAICIPVVVGVVLTTLRYFFIRWILTGEKYYFYGFFIVQIITTIILTAQSIVINIFFIVIAIKHFEKIVDIRSAVIVNIIVIILECVVVLIEFIITDGWIVLCVISIVAQIKARLEIDILSYIVQSTESARERRASGEDESETERNRFLIALDFFSLRCRAVGLI
jgi:hypothetical protein